MVDPDSYEALEDDYQLAQQEISRLETERAAWQASAELRELTIVDLRTKVAEARREEREVCQQLASHATVYADGRGTEQYDLGWVDACVHIAEAFRPPASAPEWTGGAR